jgi:hypothetical protein
LESVTANRGWRSACNQSGESAAGSVIRVTVGSLTIEP